MTATLGQLLKEVRALGLPTGEYVLAGSIPMGLADLRAVNDADVIVSDRLWKELTRRYPVEHNAIGAPCIYTGHVEILNSWYGHTGNVSELIAQAEMVHGFPTLPLEWVRRWKLLSARPKDLADVELIEAHLASPHGREGSAIRRAE
jgi:hypothetical protein